MSYLEHASARRHRHSCELALGLPFVPPQNATEVSSAHPSSGEVGIDRRRLHEYASGRMGFGALGATPGRMLGGVLDQDGGECRCKRGEFAGDRVGLRRAASWSGRNVLLKWGTAPGVGFIIMSIGPSKSKRGFSFLPTGERRALLSRVGTSGEGVITFVVRAPLLYIWAHGGIKIATCARDYREIGRQPGLDDWNRSRTSETAVEICSVDAYRRILRAAGK